MGWDGGTVTVAVSHGRSGLLGGGAGSPLPVPGGCTLGFDSLWGYAIRPGLEPEALCYLLKAQWCDYLVTALILTVTTAAGCREPVSVPESGIQR